MSWAYLISLFQDSIDLEGYSYVSNLEKLINIKKETILSLFTDNMLSYKENPKLYTEEILKLIIDFRKVWKKCACWNLFASNGFTG